MKFLSADCAWDFFSCTNKFGTWPDNKICCEERFDKCYEKVKNVTNLYETTSTTTTSKPEENSEKYSEVQGLELSKLPIQT